SARLTSVIGFTPCHAIYAEEGASGYTAQASKDTASRSGELAGLESWRSDPHEQGHGNLRIAPARPLDARLSHAGRDGSRRGRGAGSVGSLAKAHGRGRLAQGVSSQGGHPLVPQ